MERVSVKMPGIIYGTAWKEADTKGYVVQAVRQGFKGIDTACQPKHYREELVGEALLELFQQGVDRSELFIQTKFTNLMNQDPARIPYDPKASLNVQVWQSFRRSLANLHVEYLDSLVLHGPMQTFDQQMEVWGALEEIYRSGAVGQLGVSNCYHFGFLERFFQAAQVKPVVLQNRFHGVSGYDVELRRWCEDVGITYQSFWTLSHNRHLLTGPLFQELAQVHQRTPAQIMFRYLTQEGVVPLTGTTSVEHMIESLQIFEFELTAQERQVITELLSQAG